MWYYECMLTIKKLYWLLIAIFIVIVAYFVIPWPDRIMRYAFMFVMMLSGVFLFFGILLFRKTLKSKLGKNHKIALFLVSTPAIFFLISIILHNLLYALAVASKDLPILPYVFDFLHATFFILGIIGAPIAFIVGAVWYAILLKKPSNKQYNKAL